MLTPPDAVRGLPALPTLPVDLPPGHLVHGNEGSDHEPAMWVSDSPATAGLWAALRLAHRDTGLWPLLLDHLRDDPRRPWDAGELWPADMTHPSDFDPEELLADWWYRNGEADELSAVLRSWKKRFGAFVIGAGFDELTLSVAAPPTTLEQALHVAAEHFAFCPADLTGYAEQLVNAPTWGFWWD